MENTPVDDKRPGGREELIGVDSTTKENIAVEKDAQIDHCENTKTEGNAKRFVFKI